MRRGPGPGRFYVGNNERPVTLCAQCTGIPTACDVSVSNGSIGAHVVGSTTTTGVIISVWTLRFVVGVHDAIGFGAFCTL